MIKDMENLPSYYMTHLSKNYGDPLINEPNEMSRLKKISGKF